MKVVIRKSLSSDSCGTEKNHLQNFGEIGEKEGNVQKIFERAETLFFVAVDEMNEVVGYLAYYGEKSWLEWFCVKLNIIDSTLLSRKRFKRALSFYLKNDYDIRGISLGSDNELMIMMN